VSTPILIQAYVFRHDGYRLIVVADRLQCTSSSQIVIIHSSVVSLCCSQAQPPNQCSHRLLSVVRYVDILLPYQIAYLPVRVCDLIPLRHRHTLTGREQHRQWVGLPILKQWKYELTKPVKNKFKRLRYVILCIKRLLTDWLIKAKCSFNFIICSLQYRATFFL